MVEKVNIDQRDIWRHSLTVEERKAGKKPSLMNLEDLVELFKNQVIEQYKNQKNELNNDKK